MKLFHGEVISNDMQNVQPDAGYAKIRLTDEEIGHFFQLAIQRNQDFKA